MTAPSASYDGCYGFPTAQASPAGLPRRPAAAEAAEQVLAHLVRLGPHLVAPVAELARLMRDYVECHAAMAQRRHSCLAKPGNRDKITPCPAIAARPAPARHSLARRK